MISLISIFFLWPELLTSMALFSFRFVEFLAFRNVMKHALPEGAGLGSAGRTIIVIEILALSTYIAGFTILTATLYTFFDRLLA